MPKCLDIGISWSKRAATRDDDNLAENSKVRLSQTDAVDFNDTKSLGEGSPMLGGKEKPNQVQGAETDLEKKIHEGHPYRARKWQQEDPSLVTVQERASSCEDPGVQVQFTNRDGLIY